MPQAVLGIAGHCTDPSVALAVAATYVAGFRTLADGPLVDTIGRDDPPTASISAIEARARPAATAAWHGTLADRSVGDRDPGHSGVGARRTRIW